MKSKNNTAYQALCLFMLLAFAGCSLIGGDVIQTSTPAPGTDTAAGLSKATRAALENIKKGAVQNDANEGLSAVVSDKAHYLTVAQFLERYPEAESNAAANYLVGGNDVLNISVFDEKNLRCPELRVSADGYLSFPLIGRFKAAGLTTAQIEELITQKLSRGYVVDAHVSVEVKEYNSKWYRVLGAVEKPKTCSLAAHVRVLDAISTAGGIKQYQKGSGRNAKLVRMVNAGTAREEQLVVDIDLQRLMQSADQQANLLMSDKDTLFISMPENYYMLGEVKRPGAYPLIDRDISLVEAIGAAGGFTNFASRNSTKIIRNQNGQETLIRVRVDDITQAGTQLREIILQPNDIIIVPQSFF
ncbi:MAG: polysaccharide export protein [Proteobacteria bacterium]|nr:polysaccharide export protein [Pseudomonadota bacterium]